VGEVEIGALEEVSPYLRAGVGKNGRGGQAFGLRAGEQGSRGTVEGDSE